jgi:hypothetical protein
MNDSVATSRAGREGRIDRVEDDRPTLVAQLWRASVVDARELPASCSEFCHLSRYLWIDDPVAV